MIIHKDLDSLQISRMRSSPLVLLMVSIKGIKQIIKRIISLSKKVDGCSVLITFHPHPRFVLGKDVDSLKLIHTLEEKAYHLEQLGVDHLVMVPFKRFCSSITY